jgi:TonB family protein
LFFALFLHQLNAQAPEKGGGLEVQGAIFAGGAEQLAQYFAQNLNYPQEAAVRHVEGTVAVTFTIDTAGVVCDAKVRSGLGHGCDEEALRLVQAMPKWKPALLDGKPIASGATVRVDFRLPR